MLVNFDYKGKPAYAFTVFNFSQVLDTVLLVMADKKQEKATMIFTHTNGVWETSEDLSLLSAQSFKKINEALCALLDTHCQSNRFPLPKENVPPSFSQAGNSRCGYLQ